MKFGKRQYRAIRVVGPSPKTTKQNPAIAWKGRDGKYRVIDYPYDKSRMTVNTKPPEGAKMVQDARSAFDVAKSFYGKTPSNKLVSQMQADRIQEAKQMGFTGNMPAAISDGPVSISRKPPRISE